MKITDRLLMHALEAAGGLFALLGTLTTPTPIKSSTAALRAHETLTALWGRERWEK